MWPRPRPEAARCSTDRAPANAKAGGTRRRFPTTDGRHAARHALPDQVNAGMDEANRSTGEGEHACEPPSYDAHGALCAPHQINGRMGEIAAHRAPTTPPAQGILGSRGAEWVGIRGAWVAAQGARSSNNVSIMLRQSRRSHPNCAISTALTLHVPSSHSVSSVSTAPRRPLRIGTYTAADLTCSAHGGGGGSAVSCPSLTSPSIGPLLSGHIPRRTRLSRPHATL
jgi:hypothetical protein